MKLLLYNLKKQTHWTQHQHPSYVHRCPRVSASCLGCCSSMTQTSWLMHAGHCPTYLMAPMTKSRLLLTLESVVGWLSCWCKALNFERLYKWNFSLQRKSCVFTTRQCHHYTGCDNSDVGVLWTFLGQYLSLTNELPENTLHFQKSQ